jgi:hypothetical protein
MGESGSKLTIPHGFFDLRQTVGNLLHLMVGQREPVLYQKRAALS